MVSAGFKKGAKRECALWDLRNLGKRVKNHMLNGDSICLVDYDCDTNIAFLSGKGDGTISMFELVEGELYNNGIYRSKDYSMSTSFGCRRCVDTSKNEVARAFKLGKNYVETISFLYPRKVLFFNILYNF